ncbi:uncharacterized protein DSM5745_02905 [Aspergillus mulundensis]|uniref:Galactosyl transferase GMA12/MNN10 family protein n=1 Tax=Aspergillus mulundensis TaxID=1810919 RepID=A0A3D8SIY9_9EURO|nr:Uncharacterized protein DSM5745_02905 [Aspergillus mulundensis]RDW86263.1 Uncharacterized protein DSM5745_02905 [Aspergillus mulundensis]
MNQGFKPRRRGLLQLKSVLRVVAAFIACFSLLRLFAIYPNASTEISVNNRPRPTVGKVMMIYGNNTVYERAVATHKDHCERLGYPLFLLRRQVLDGVWNKLAYLISLIVQELEKPAEERLEWLFWADSDTIVMNPNMRLETFLPPRHLTDVHIVLSKDWNGMNAGVFPIRVHPWSIELLSAAIGYPFTSPGKGLYWAEQSALCWLFEEHEYYSRSVAYVPLRWFNAYMRAPDGESLNKDSPAELQVHPGDFLVHFPGTPKDHFNETLSPYLAIAEEHRPEWELPIEETVFPVETAKFWRKYSAEHGIEYPDGL